jgi:hypothetical protein
MGKSRTTVKFTVTLPSADDDVGVWMENNGASLTLHCMLGTYTATVATKRLISFGDAAGEHSEHWTVSRRGRDAGEAIRAAFEAAVDRTRVDALVAKALKEGAL